MSPLLIALIVLLVVPVLMLWAIDRIATRRHNAKYHSKPGDPPPCTWARP